MLLLSGLIIITIPVTIYKLGGLDALRQSLPPEYFSLSNISPATFINWMVTIIPAWLIGNTIYQRMYACKSEHEAKRAWYIAGLIEYPVMAFAGAFLGMCARVIAPHAEPEMAMPILIRDVLPAGVTGIVIVAYFSAIMSTADSCLMASSGNFVNDIIERYFVRNISAKSSIRLSMLVTLIIGVLSVIVAAKFTSVLNAGLYTYAFMVSGLFVPTLGAYFWKSSSCAGAMAGMIAGGLTTLLLLTNILVLPDMLAALDLYAGLYGMLCSAVTFVGVSILFPD
jgi:SSS family solute:Na+ symporter